jgi:membrane-associated phospholipid phosphatase
MMVVSPDTSRGKPQTAHAPVGRPLIVVLALLGPALVAGVLVTLALRRWPVFDPASARPATRAAHEFERELAAHHGFARFLRDRMDPRTATGLLLTAALALVLVAGVVVGVLALLVRLHSTLIDIDSSVAPWGAQHTDAFTKDVLDVVTSLGSGNVLFPLVTAVAVFELVRRPNRWLPVFALAVGVGQALLSNTIKDLVERVRPAVTPVASTLGPAFPSGHTTGAAACFAALALLLGRGRSRTTQAVLAGTAVFVALAVAASRVLLGVHWLTDTIGGLALGWGWFAVCSIAFGGRLLRFGLPVEAAERAAPRDEPAAARPS